MISKKPLCCELLGPPKAFNRIDIPVIDKITGEKTIWRVGPQNAERLKNLGWDGSKELVVEFKQ
jgi:hypothetical protein